MCGDGGGIGGGNGGGGGGQLASLDVGSARKNGILQIVAGSASILGVFILANIRNFGYLFGIVGSGLPGFVIFVLGGIFLLLAGHRRSYCWTITALVFASLNVLNSLFNFSSNLIFFYFLRFCDSSYVDWNWWMVVTHSIMTLAASTQLFVVLWAVVITSKALCYRSKQPSIEHRNLHAKTASFQANWIAQFWSTAASIVLSIVILLLVETNAAHHVDHPSQIPLYQQNSGVFLWWGPVYLLNVYLGFRSWRFGENSSLVSFLIVNIVQLVLIPWEIGVSATTILDAQWRKEADWNPESPRHHQSSTWNPVTAYPNWYTTPDWYPWPRTTPEWPYPTRNPWPRTTVEPAPKPGNEFYDGLTALHCLIIISAVLHFIVSIWAIVAASIAAQRGEACCGFSDGSEECCCPSENDASVTQPHTVRMVVQEGAAPGSYILIPAGDGQTALHSVVHLGAIVPPTALDPGNVPLAGVPIPYFSAPAGVVPAVVAPAVHYVTVVPDSQLNENVCGQPNVA